VRVRTSSLGLDPDALVPGRDLVLDIDIGHGALLPEGVFAHDLLDVEERRHIDELTVRSLNQWRERFDARMTVDGVCWPWVWEWQLHLSLFPLAHRALALRRALELHRPAELELADSDPATRALAEAVALPLGVPVRAAHGAQPPPADVTPAPRPALHRRARRRALAAAKRLGAPSLLRRGSVVFHSYWPLEPLLDAMLAKPEWRPAVCLEKLPTGARRWLRAAAQGGWVGLPTARDLAKARAQARGLAGQVPDCTIDVDGIDLSAPFRGVLGEVIETRAHELADVPMLRRAFRRRRPRWVLGAYDSAPHARIVISLAKEAGIPTLGVSHGAYFVPQTLTDLDICDEAALWTPEVAPRMERLDRPIHQVGYPLPHDPPPRERPSAAPAAPRVLILGQYAVPHTAMLDKRLTARSWETAVEAVAERLSGARAVLRPHPFERFATGSPLAERFPGRELSVDRSTPIMELLEEADLIIGGTSTATVQAALTGTPAIALNLSGFDWPWPLGGHTSVPVARSREELDAVLGRFAESGYLPGQDDMLAALGADGGDAVAKLLEILEGGPGHPAHITSPPATGRFAPVR
jgi:hypothetical protein